MNQNPMYEYHHTSPGPKRRGNGGLIALVIVLALLFGALGAWLMMRFGADLRTGTAANAPVNIQTVATQSGDTAAGLYDDLTQIERIAEIGKASIVEVSTEARVTHPYFGSYVTSGAGSGVIISGDGYIVTNDHVVAASDSICVQLPDGTLHDAVLVGTDVQTDLAVIKIDATGLTPAVFADSDTARVGELAVAIGNPLGTLGGSVTEGIISAKDREIVIGGEAMVLLQTSAAISPGNSGGGLFDKDGHIVGIVNAKSGEAHVEGIGFAIPANTAREITASLIENGYVTGRPLLGVRAATASSYDAYYRYGASRPGVYVTAAAQGISLRTGDRIIAIGGTDVESVSQVKSLISQYTIGDTVSVGIIRGGRESTVDVTLQERSADMDASVI